MLKVHLRRFRSNYCLRVFYIIVTSEIKEGVPELDICIAFTPMPALQNPNVITRNTIDSVNTYYQMIIVSFFSLRKCNSSAKLILITTDYPPGKYLTQLNDFGVEIRLVPFLHRPPEGYAKKFLGCFYLIDAMISQGENDSVYVDPDVVCIKSLGDLGQRYPSASGYPLEFRSGEDLNGITYEESVSIARDFFGGKRKINSYTFFGGEFFLIPKSIHLEFSNLVDDLYQFSLARFFKGESFFPTEEHLISAALSEFKVIEENALIKRIWTARQFRNVDGSERSLSLLHLPAEKEFGFKKAYRRLSSLRGLEEFDDFKLFEEFIFRVFQLNRRTRLRTIDLVIRRIRSRIRFSN